MSKSLIRTFSPLIFILSFFLISCHGQRTIVQNNTISQQPTPGGTDNTGGGSGIDGKTFEDYIERDITKLPSFQKVVFPIFEKIKLSSPNLAADFYHIAHQREWYFVPGPVKKISESIIGAYSKSEQLALQDLNKVWIDRKLFSEMSENAQGNLILHEIIMGIRLMQYQDKMDQCIARMSIYALNPETMKNYKEKKFKCRRSFPRVPGFEKQSFNLNKNDYDTVRKIVVLLDKVEPDVEEVLSIIESHGIRKYE
ncbi:MAG: hypothetical protein ACK5V3_01855 [Bdellovibrionales bacterium]